MITRRNFCVGLAGAGMGALFAHAPLLPTPATKTLTVVFPQNAEKGMALPISLPFDGFYKGTVNKDVICKSENGKKLETAVPLKSGDILVFTLTEPAPKGMQADFIFETNSPHGG